MLSADASSLVKLGSSLRKARPAVYRQLRHELTAIGEEVAVGARERASWSKRIPGTIKPNVRGGTIVVVRAGGKNAPHAKAYEHAGREGTFRHPDWPDPSRPRSEWAWSTQAARPFLHPAAMENLQERAEQIAAAVARVLDHLDRV